MQRMFHPKRVSEASEAAAGYDESILRGMCASMIAIVAYLIVAVMAPGKTETKLIIFVPLVMVTIVAIMTAVSKFAARRYQKALDNKTIVELPDRLAGIFTTEQGAKAEVVQAYDLHVYEALVRMVGGKPEEVTNEAVAAFLQRLPRLNATDTVLPPN